MAATRPKGRFSSAVEGADLRGEGIDKVTAQRALIACAKHYIRYSIRFTPNLHARHTAVSAADAGEEEGQALIGNVEGAGTSAKRIKEALSEQ